MKKLIAVLLIAMMITPVVSMACNEQAVLPNVESNTWSMTGCAWIALHAEYNLLYGKTSEGETLEVCPAKSAKNPFVRGIRDDGIIRHKGEMAYMLIDGKVLGLTKTEVRVEISAEYWEFVENIVLRRMGNKAEMTPENVIACTIGRTENTLYHYFFRSFVSHIAVGTVVFNGKNTVALYMGDWNGDGMAELGFEVNKGTQATEEPKPSETPEPASTPQPASTKKTKTVTTKQKTCVNTKTETKTCTQVIQVINQVNINSAVNNFQKANIVNGKDGGCTSGKK